MNNIYKGLTWLALIVAIFGLFLPTAFDTLGGTTNYNALDVTDGYSVDGTEVISATGVLTGVITTANAVTVTGETNLDSLIQGGSIVTVAVPGNPTAAQVCNNHVLNFTWTTGSSTAVFTTPTFTNLAADCLTANGDDILVLFRNTNATAASTTAITAPNASTTLLGPSSGDDIINGGNSAWLRFIRLTANTGLVTTEEITDAD